ncbi:recombinase family protein, partial [Salmonella sp. S87]|uniref:helix-turn-helix domain-containing protein n=1 Tax=Salmonella sp. S87 TaxID=2961624 RepID=UPI00345FF06B|nr:recombinase family protein [Salmonella sp. S87]
KGMISLSPPTICNSAVYRLYTIEKMGATAIARQLGIGRASVYRALENYEQPA